MDIQYIREFVCLAKFRNYMNAAEELFISQSSLSKHIIALEKELGFPLFNRTTRKVGLTQYGTTFLPYAQRIIDADAEFRNKVAMMKTEVRNSVRFGVLPAFLSYNMEDGLADFRHKFPQYPFSLVEGANSMLLQHLKDGTCNIAMIRTFEEPLSSEFKAIPLLQDRISLITVSGSIFDTDRPYVTWQELEQAKLLTSTSSQQARMLDTFTKRMNIHLNIISRLSRMPTIVEMLRKGLGNAALLNKTVSATFQNDLNFRILDIEPPLYNTVSLVYLKDRPVTAAMRSFIDTLLPHVAKGDFAHV
jgi:LysR family transcriptional activator of glutamate synthase operon